MNRPRAPQPQGQAVMNQHAALIYTMVLVSAADRQMTDAELHVIGDMVNHLPVFDGYDPKRLTQDLKDCAALLGGERGLEAILEAIRRALPASLSETAYAIACDVAAAGSSAAEVARVLELLRHRLGLERLIAAGIERGAKARFARA
jgi:tellurite resistance protein